MDYRFVLQDPSAGDTVYLYEEIVAQLDDEETGSWRGMFAFASSGGVSKLFEDSAVRAYLGRGGSCELLVGLDAITDPSALRTLQHLQTEYPLAVATVFHNVSARLFHPKISHFRRRNGREVVVAGSGNLTPGGLQSNIEAYSVAEFAADSCPDLSQWDGFIDRHRDEIREIDDDAFARAELNRRLARANRRTARTVVGSTPPPPAEALQEDPTQTDSSGVEDGAPDHFAPTDRVMIAEVPRASDRWQQIGLNRDVVDEFLRVNPETAQRVFLREARKSGKYGDEEVRKCLLGRVNLNPRIEFGSRRGDPYPTQGPPLLAMHEVGLRHFLYAIVLPGEPAYEELAGVIRGNPTTGKGLRRVILSRGTLLEQWPDCYI